MVSGESEKRRKSLISIAVECQKKSRSGNRVATFAAGLEQSLLPHPATHLADCTLQAPSNLPVPIVRLKGSFRSLHCLWRYVFLLIELPTYLSIRKRWFANEHRVNHS